MDTVEPVHPDGGLAVELVPVLGVAVELLRLAVGRFPPDAVGVVGLVVEDEDVLLAAHLAPEHPVDERGVALHVTQ